MTQELGNESPLMLFSSAVGGLSCREVCSGLFLISSKSRWPARGQLRRSAPSWRIIVSVTFQEAHLLSIILCLPFVLQTRRYDNCSNPNGPRDLYLFLRLNRSMKISNGGRFFCSWSISLYFERKDKWWHKGSRSKRDVRPFDCWIRWSPFTDSSGEDNRGLHSHEIPLGELQVFSVFDYPVPLPNVVHCISITLSNKVKSWCLSNSQLFTQLQAYEI